MLLLKSLQRFPKNKLSYIKFINKPFSFQNQCFNNRTYDFIINKLVPQGFPSSDLVIPALIWPNTQTVESIELKGRNSRYPKRVIFI